MGNIKSSQVLSGTLFLSGGIFFGILTLLLTLIPKKFTIHFFGKEFVSNSTFMSEALFGWIFIAIFIIVFIEISIFLIKKGIEIDEAKLGYVLSAWSLIGRFYLFKDMLSSILWILGFIIAISLLIFLWVNLVMYNSVTFSTAFFVLIGIYVLYFILRVPLKYLFRKISSKITKVSKGWLPKYTVYKKGISLDLNFKNIQNRGKKYIVNIDFNEIDEIKTFSYFEAQNFEKYQIGPNVELVARSTRDMYKYLKGEISKPLVYIHGLSSIRKIVLIRGPNIFYFLPFDIEDVSDMINAFNLFKNLQK